LSLCAAGRPQDEVPAPEIESEGSIQQKLRRYDAYLANQFITHDSAKGIDVELSTRG
jgi:hypothetical protein